MKITQLSEKAITSENDWLIVEDSGGTYKMAADKFLQGTMSRSYLQYTGKDEIDADTLLETGLYYGAFIAASRPIQTWANFFIEVMHFKGSSDIYVQRFTKSDGSASFIRSKFVAGTWTNFQIQNGEQTINSTSIAPGSYSGWFPDRYVLSTIRIFVVGIGYCRLDPTTGNKNMYTGFSLVRSSTNGEDIVISASIEIERDDVNKRIRFKNTKVKTSTWGNIANLEKNPDKTISSITWIP